MAIAYAQYIICNNQNAENDSSNPACNIKFLKTAHPDLHFIYPTVSTEDKNKTKSIDFIREWREFLEQNLYASLFDWYQILGVKK
jgi:DNA polymerase-3 subunit delta'